MQLFGYKLCMEKREKYTQKMSCISCNIPVVNAAGALRAGFTCESCCLDNGVDCFLKSTVGSCDICGLRTDVVLGILPVCPDCSWAPFVNWHLVSDAQQSVITTKPERDYITVLGEQISLNNPEYRGLLGKVLSGKYAIVPSEVPIQLSHEFTRGDWTDSWWDACAFIGAKAQLTYNSMFFDMHGVTINASVGGLKLPTTILAGIKLLYNEDEDDVADFMLLHFNKVKGLRAVVCHRDASPVGHVMATPFWEKDFQTECIPSANGCEAGADSADLSPDIDNIVEFPKLEHTKVL